MTFATDGVFAGLTDDLLCEVLELLIVEAAAQQLQLHLEATGIADALDRRRRQHVGLPVRQRGDRLLQTSIQRQQILAACLYAFAERLQHDPDGSRVGQVGAVVEHRHA